MKCVKEKLRPQERLYVALNWLDFSWYQSEIEQIKAWWREGMSVFDMGEEMRRDPDEIAILVMDLIRRGTINPRKGGAYGSAV